MKYGVVGAIALAVLVAATWDGAKSKKRGEELAKGGDTSGVTSSTDVAMTGDLGTAHTQPPPTESPPRVAEVPKPIEGPRTPVEDVLEKHQVHPGETMKSIARTWLGDEKLVDELYEYNKARIPDLRHLSSRLTLVFPRSKFAKSAGGTSSEENASIPQAPTMPAGMKKDDKPKAMPASSLRDDGGNSGADKKYAVKEGDTLYGIAARELGKGSRWKEIQKLNHLGTETVKKGQTILLPAR